MNGPPPPAPPPQLRTVQGGRTGHGRVGITRVATATIASALLNIHIYIIYHTSTSTNIVQGCQLGAGRSMGKPMGACPPPPPPRAPTVWLAVQRRAAADGAQCIPAGSAEAFCCLP